MEHRLITSVCAGFVLASVLGSVVLAEPALQVPAVTYAFNGDACGISDRPIASRQGNKLHLKLRNRGWMESADPRLTGPVVVDVEVFINDINGHVNGHGSLVLQPSGYSGTWVADFNIQAPEGKSIDVNGIMIVKDSRMNARGTGEFEGQWFFFEHGLARSDPPYEIPVEGPDGCEFEDEIWTGSILNPNAA
jgi:hypothetical protein